MYLFADLVIILVFLIGSAVLGFLLGRRSYRGALTQLREQLQDRQRALADLKVTLKRCTTRRIALERELTEVRTHLSAQGLDVVATKPVATQASPLARVTTPAPVSPSVSQDEARQAAPGQRFRRPSEGRSGAAQPVAQTPREVATPPSKQDETLQRVRARAGKINFDRIGTADPQSRDDLKEIKGIGIFIEKKLNALGIYTYAQIARFNEEDQQAVNEAIEFFPGRIVRDEWVAQARKLAQ